MKIRINDIGFKVSNDVNKIVQKIHSNISFWDEVNDGNWEKATFDVIDRFVTKDNVMLDLGAWAGPITLYAASKGILVHAVEPDKTIFEVLQKNIELNEDLQANIRAYPVAITDGNKQVTLNAKGAYGLSTSSILNRLDDDLSGIEVPGITLESFIKKQQITTVHFIKVDVEGAEFSIIPAWTETLTELQMPTLLLAFHHNFLNQSIYMDKFKMQILVKLAFKLEHLFKFNFLSTAIKRKVKKVLEALSDYKYIYLDDGRPVTKNYLLNNPLEMKSHSVVFTNIPWNNDS